MSDGRVFAPWTPEQVESLNAFQQSGWYHPYTCGHDPGHTLVAATDGWYCPVLGDWKQTWAHEWMTNLEWAGFHQVAVDLEIAP